MFGIADLRNRGLESCQLLSTKFNPVQLMMLSIYLLGGLSLSCLPSTVPYKTGLNKINEID